MLYSELVRAVCIAWYVVTLKNSVPRDWTIAVHQAARIGDAGHGGQVLLSTTTANLVRDDLPGGIGLRDLGPTELADFDHPERLFQLEIPGLPNDFAPLSARREKAPRIDRKSVV